MGVGVLSVMCEFSSFRSHTGDTPTRRCFTPSGSPDGSDDTDDVVSVYSSGGPNGSGRSSASSQGTAYPDPRKRRSVSIAAELGSLLDIFLSQVCGRVTMWAGQAVPVVISILFEMAV